MAKAQLGVGKSGVPSCHDDCGSDDEDRGELPMPFQDKMRILVRTTHAIWLYQLSGSQVLLVSAV